MKKLLAPLSLFLLLPALAAASEVAGVRLPETATVDGKTLKLNGAGLRKKLLFKVYVAGLYVENPSKDAASILSATEIKSMHLHILRSLKGSQITDAISEGFERNSKAQIPKLKPRLDKLGTMIPDVVEGDEIALTWIPDKGTNVTVRGTDRGVIEGRDFADALFAVWLGPNPVQDDLKKALLGAP
ncbi:MAG TPA: chalcone isomerase family protein [Thermoanaerobaculia bacterium]|nr:chalcone isomerase family protein [Thermoanaerobaculia bacterium]